MNADYRALARAALYAHGLQSKHVAGVRANQSALARLLGVQRSTVNKWFKGKEFPPHRAIEIEKATGGEVTRGELLPGFFETEAKK